MRMLLVSSRDFSAIGYEDEVLYIRFTNGSIYAYLDVAESVYDSFLKATSRCEFFRTFVNDQYMRLKIE